MRLELSRNTNQTGGKIMPIFAIEYASDPRRVPDNAMHESDELVAMRKLNMELRIEIEACYQRIEELERDHRIHADIFEEAIHG